MYIDSSSSLLGMDTWPKSSFVSVSNWWRESYSPPHQLSGRIRRDKLLVADSPHILVG